MKMTRLIKVSTAIALMALPTTLNAQIDIFDIYRTTDLNAGFGATPYEPDYPADGGSETIFIDSELPPGGRAFYRVVRQ